MNGNRLATATNTRVVDMTRFDHILRTLSTLEVDRPPVILDCSPDFAESVWFAHVNYRDARALELVVEPFGKSSCKVSVRHFEGEADWGVRTWVYLAIILTCVTWGFYG